MRPTPTLVVALWTVFAAAGAEVGRVPTLTARVYDYVGVPARTLSKAEVAAQRVLRKARIDIEWINCPKDRDEEERYPACRKPGSAGDVILHIVPRSMEGYEVGPKAFGFALPSIDGGQAKHAYVFYGRVVQAVQAGGKVSVPTLLGSVMVHEIGHLLLGPSMHSSRGIMRPCWQPGELRDMESGRLMFSSDLVGALQARARARVESASR